MDQQQDRYVLFLAGEAGVGKDTLADIIIEILNTERPELRVGKVALAAPLKLFTKAILEYVYKTEFPIEWFYIEEEKAKDRPEYTFRGAPLKLRFALQYFGTEIFRDLVHDRIHIEEMVRSITSCASLCTPPNDIQLTLTKISSNISTMVGIDQSSYSYTKFGIYVNSQLSKYFPKHFISFDRDLASEVEKSINSQPVYDVTIICDNRFPNEIPVTKELFQRIDWINWKMSSCRIVRDSKSKDQKVSSHASESSIKQIDVDMEYKNNGTMENLHEFAHQWIINMGLLMKK